MLVTDLVLTHLYGPGLVEVARTQQGDSATTTILTELRDVEGRLGELAHMFDRREISAHEWSSARAPLERDREALNGRLMSGTRAAAAGRLAGQGGSLNSRWATLTLDEQRAVVVAVLDRVVIKPATRRGRWFDPDRVEPVWKV